MTLLENGKNAEKLSKVVACQRVDCRDRFHSKTSPDCCGPFFLEETRDWRLEIGDESGSFLILEDYRK